MAALPNVSKVSQPDQLARNKGIFSNGATPTNGAPLEIQISTATPANMPPTGVLSVWATGAGLQTSVDGGTTVVSSGTVIVARELLAASVDNTIFIANRAYTLIGVRAVITVAGSGGAASVDVKKCTGTQAPASGTTMLTAAFDLTTTANTVTTPALTATAANLKLAAGDRIALDYTGTLTSLVGSIELIIAPA